MTFTTFLVVLVCVSLTPLLIGILLSFFDGFYDSIAFGLIISMFVAIVVFCVGYGGYYSQQNACAKQAAAMHRAHQYGWFTDCLIKDGDRYIPLDQWYRNEHSDR